MLPLRVATPSPVTSLCILDLSDQSVDILHRVAFPIGQCHIRPELFATIPALL